MSVPFTKYYEYNTLPTRSHYLKINSTILCNQCKASFLLCADMFFFVENKQLYFCLFFIVVLLFILLMYLLFVLLLYLLFVSVLVVCCVYVFYMLIYLLQLCVG